MNQKKIITNQSSTQNQSTMILYKGSLDCGMKTVRNEGFSALYKGFIPTWVRMGPWNIIFFITYEQLKQMHWTSLFWCSPTVQLDPNLKINCSNRYFVNCVLCVFRHRILSYILIHTNKKRRRRKKQWNYIKTKKTCVINRKWNDLNLFKIGQKSRLNCLRFTSRRE